MPKLIQKIVCGFGNQLFFIFNAISLALDYNLDLEIELTSIDSKRPNFTKYKIFANSKINKIARIKANNLKHIKQIKFSYEKIVLEPNTNYLIDGGKDGYFQSYKYFWHNVDKIKEYLNVPNNIFEKYGNIIKSIGKKTIAVHIRLTDYVKYKSYFYNYPISYYKEVLSKYNLDEYEIILFSDDIVKANQLLSTIIPSNKIILANNYSSDDEEQFVMMCHTDIRILCNSTYSLWSCYLNEIYGFNQNSTYWFGNKWFGINGPSFKLEDLIPIENPKYNVYEL